MPSEGRTPCLPEQTCLSIVPVTGSLSGAGARGCSGAVSSRCGRWQGQVPAALGIFSDPVFKGVFSKWLRRVSSC